MATLSHNSTLLCIDFQLGFQDQAYWGGGRNNPDAEVVAARVLSLWRSHGWDIIHVRHSSENIDSRLHPSNEGFGFHPKAAPIGDEKVITKTVNSAFIGTDLHEVLQSRSSHNLVIMGLTTDHCVSTTTRMAGNLGYNTRLISDACATFDRTGVDGERFTANIIHTTALASLHQEFAEVITSQNLT